MKHFFRGGANVVSLSEYQVGMRFPVINEVEAYWDGLRNGRALPMRSEIDPRGLERALENAFILERVAPGIVRFRLAGCHLNTLMGMDVRGMPLSAFFTGPARDELSREIEALFDRPQTLRLSLSGERGIGKPALEGAMLLLPLHNELGVVTRALGVLVSEGNIGRAPRRFRIAASKATALSDVQTTPRHPAAQPGFCEAEAPAFKPSGQEKPTLTLIKSGV